jgi:serine/threonine-protein kinase
MDTDRNLLFGVLALQADLIDDAQFARACSEWAGPKQTSLAGLLVERGWLTPADRDDVEKLLQRKLRKHSGDARASLAEVTTDPVKRTLAGLTDPEVRQSLAGPTTPARGPGPLATTPCEPEARDRYTLSRLHATGGIGRVWLARDASLGRDVALKELRPEWAGHPAVSARFLKEAQVTGQLEHPGIVPIYELGRRPEDQQPFYTMRFVRGRTLAEAAAAYHRRRAAGEAGPLELRELLTAFGGVCNAVAYAHSRGVLHRDLKPQNVVLGDFGEVVVLDWGLARLVGQADDAVPPLELPPEGQAGGTAQGQVLGTPAYMAPEQAEGRLDVIDRRTDIYGLGAILYEILTGRPPFKGGDMAAVLRQVAHESPARPRSVEKGAPAALEAVCLKALAKRPGERYGSAQELAAEVQRWLADEPVSAYREPLAARAGRWVKRHRVLVTGAAAALLVALVGLAAVLAVQARSNRELAAANRQLEEANERERQRFDLALEAIKTFHTGVSDDVLLKQDQFRELRDKLLGWAAAFYGKLEQLLVGQADERSRRALGRAYFDLAELTERIGSKSEALQVYRQALALWQGLAEANPGDAYLQRQAAACHNHSGNLLWASGRPQDALAEDQKALTIFQALADAEPADAKHQSDLAGQYSNIGLRLAATGRTQEALAAYERARVIQDKLVEANPTVTQYQEFLANHYSNIGVVLTETGRLQEALATHQKALAIRQGLADANAGVASYARDLALSHYSIGVLLGMTGKPEEALAAHRKALAARQELAGANPTDTQLQADLGHSHGQIGALLLQAGKPAEALAAYQRARAIRQKLADANPVPQFQSDLAWIHNNIGVLLTNVGKPQEALAAFEQARAIRQKLADANPAVTQYQMDLGWTHNGVGQVFLQTGKLAEALAAFEQARAIRQKLADANPAVTQYQTDLGWSENYVGRLLSKTGQADEALAAYERARVIQQKLADADPTRAEYQVALASTLSGLGIIQRRRGRAAEAAASFRRAVAAMEQLPSPGPAELYNLACYQALQAGAAAEGSGLTAAEARAAADGAMATLRRAVAAGFRNAAHLRADTDLDALRPRDDFQKLIQDLEANPEAKVP